jgi:hypothetical protein
MSEATGSRLGDRLTLTVCAAMFGLLPLYNAYWWWDLWAHWLAGLAITAVVRYVTDEWWLSLLAVVGLGLGWEWAEVISESQYLIEPTVTDTVSDLAAEVLAWTCYRVAYALVWRDLGAVLSRA